MGTCEVITPDNKNPCPVDYCGATPGGPCIGKNGQILTKTHSQRHKKHDKTPVKGYSADIDTQSELSRTHERPTGEFMPWQDDEEDEDDSHFMEFMRISGVLDDE